MTHAVTRHASAIVAPRSLTVPESPFLHTKIRGARENIENTHN
jgi:hypothetical protein